MSIKGRVELSARAIGGAGTTLLLMGMLAAAYGPLLPYFMRRFSIAVPVAGLVFGIHFSGAFLGVIASMITLARFPSKVIISTSLTLLAAGCLGVAIAPTWPLTLAAVFVIGVGFGQLDLGVNQLLAYSVNPARVALLNGLNGVYGIGAVAAPLLVSLAADRYPGLYAGAVLIAIVATSGLRAVAGSLNVPAERQTDGPLQLRLIALFALAFGLYVGVEIGVAGWMPTHLHAAGYALAAAAAITSGFWLALALGRFLIAPLSMRVREGPIVLVATTVAVVTLLLALVPAVAPIAYIITGLVIAPIFPTGVAWLARLNRGNPRATSWLFPASMVGGALIPTIAGLVIARLGIGWAPGMFALVAAGSAAAFAAASPADSIRRIVARQEIGNSGDYRRRLGP